MPLSHALCLNQSWSSQQDEQKILLKEICSARLWFAKTNHPFDAGRPVEQAMVPSANFHFEAVGVAHVAAATRFNSFSFYNRHVAKTNKRNCGKKCGEGRYKIGDGKV